MAFLGVYRAVYDYAPQSEEELEIKDGDLLFILEKSTEDDWWKAKKKAATDEDDEPEGLIPNNYVEEAKSMYQARALYDYTKQTDEEMTFKEDAPLEVYDTSDPDWTLVGANGEYGFAPAIYIEKTTGASHAPAPGKVEPEAPAMPPRPTAPVDDGPIPGEADYVPPSQNNPAAALAGIIAQRTGGAPEPAEEVAPALPQRQLAQPPPMPTRPQYTPEESEEEVEEEPPSLPTRPVSQPPPPAPPEKDDVPSPKNKRSKKVQINGHNSRRASDPRSPGSFRLYNIYEMVSHMGKNKKMPTTLGINVARGLISISPEQRSDGPSEEWTAEKLTHYSIEGKHVFVELIRPSKSIDFHAGAKDTAKEIVAQLGELAGAVRQEGLREVLAASAGTGASGYKSGHMVYEFQAQGVDEVTVAVGDDVIVLDDRSSDEWWKVRRLRNGKEGVVPASYVEVTGTSEMGPETITGLNAARSTVEQNRLEEARLTKEAAKRSSRKPDADSDIPERGSSLATDSKRSSGKGKDQAKSKPNTSRVREWTDRTGSFKVEAEFIGLREGKIHLHKLNGVKIAVPVGKMAVEDLEYVERATGQSLDDEKPLSDIKRRSTLKAKEKNGITAGATIEKKDTYDWFDFFLQCGVNPQICERYANAFSRDQMGQESLPDVNEALLRTLGLKEGDIIRVMKFLDAKFDRKKETSEASSSKGPNGSLFTDASGALVNNTRKGRPAPPIQTNNTIDDDAFKPKPAEKDVPAGVSTPGSSTPTPGSARKLGFDDDAWDNRPARSKPQPAAPQPVVEPPKPRVNDDIASLAVSAPPLVPTQAPAPAISAQPTAQPAASPVSAQPQGADSEIFAKIAALAPQQTAAPRQRPAPPAQNLTAGALAPPPRAASAPGFPPQQMTQSPLQPHYTGFQPQIQLAAPGQSLQDLQTLQRLQQQGLIVQPTGFSPQQNGMQGYAQPAQMMPQQTAIQSMQQNYPSLQPQPTGFIPQSQFGQAAYGAPPMPSTQQALINGAATGSPFADPSARPYGTPQPSFAPQQTGFPSQPGFGAQPTGMNGFGAQPTAGPAPQLPPQQTGGVFGPSQPIAPLIPQKTGPTPPVRFGVQPGAKPLVAQRTGRAELSRATPQNPFGF